MLLPQGQVRLSRTVRGLPGGSLGLAPISEPVLPHPLILASSALSGNEDSGFSGYNAASDSLQAAVQSQFGDLIAYAKQHGVEIDLNRINSVGMLNCSGSVDSCINLNNSGGPGYLRMVFNTLKYLKENIPATIQPLIQLTTIAECNPSPCRYLPMRGPLFFARDGKYETGYYFLYLLPESLSEIIAVARGNIQAIQRLQAKLQTQPKPLVPLLSTAGITSDGNPITDAKQALAMILVAFNPVEGIQTLVSEEQIPMSELFPPELVAIIRDYRLRQAEIMVKGVGTFFSSLSSFTGFVSSKLNTLKTEIQKMAPVLKTFATVAGIASIPGKIIEGAANVVGDVAKFALTNSPFSLIQKAAQVIPGVKEVYQGMDALTGGGLTTVASVSTIPGRLAAGEKVSRDEVLEGIALGAKIGAVALSGGSAAAVIAASSSQLKQGTLGQSALGRTLLSVGEAAGIAMASGQSITDVALSKAKEAGVQAAVDKTGLADQGIVGKLAASGVQAGASSSLQVSSGGVSLDTTHALTSVQSGIVDQGKAQATQAVVEKVGGGSAVQSIVGGATQGALNQDLTLNRMLDLGVQTAKTEVVQRTGIVGKTGMEILENGLPSSERLSNALVNLPENAAQAVARKVLEEQSRLVAEANAKAVKMAEEYVKAKTDLVDLSSQAQAARDRAAKALGTPITIQALDDLNVKADDLERLVLLAAETLAQKQEGAMTAVEEMNAAEDQAVQAYTAAIEGAVWDATHFWFDLRHPIWKHQAGSTALSNIVA